MPPVDPIRQITVPASANGTVPTPLVPATLTPDAPGMFAGLRVVSARELQKDALCMLLYASPGVGKTTLAGMFSEYPSARRVLMVDVEGGATAVTNFDYIDVVQVQKWQEINNILTALERTPRDALQYRTVCFDNISEMQMMNLRTITTGDVGIQHWGKNTTNMMEFARRCRDLARFKGINVVLIAWQDTEKDENTSRVRTGVALTNKLSARLPGVVNVVGYLSIMDNPPTHTRVLSFAASPRTDAKFRRARGDAASPIPLELYYGENTNPIVDILRTLYEDVPFPVQKYARPKGRASQQQTANSEGAEAVSSVTT